MSIAIYPGSFDPVTYGHLDIMKRAATAFDELFVVVMINRKKTPMFTVEERVSMIENELKDYKNITVMAYEGLLIDCARQVHAGIIVKGLRSQDDFNYEYNMAMMNRRIDPNIETVFMMAEAPYIFVSSSLVKEAASFGAPLHELVPPAVETAVKERMKK